MGLQEKYDTLQAQLSDPEVISDMKKYVQLNKEYKELAPIIKAGTEYKRMIEVIRERFGLTSLKFNTVETLVEAIGLPKCKICTHCFDGSSRF